jgi:two-component system, chemotaxis family, protein-glutamate methylesterase/glutaminase
MAPFNPISSKPVVARSEIIVIGASMGGFHALRQVISDFPEDLAASVLVVLHIPSDHESYLAESFGRTAKLPVVSAEDQEVIKPGHVYVAVPDFHLRIKAGRIQLDHGPRHNFHRPAVDTLFSSAALEFGPKVVGVVLTGALDDGTCGLMEIKRHGGIAVVQDPADAANPSMPASAMDCVPIDHCVPLSRMASLLSWLAGQPVSVSAVEQGVQMPEPSKPELSTHICPECNGPMWYVEIGKLIHFHCRIGHAFSGQSLLVEKTVALESALWSAVNALKDKANIANRLAQRASDDTGSESAVYFQEQAESAERYASVITEILLKQSSPTILADKKSKGASVEE